MTGRSKREQNLMRRLEKLREQEAALGFSADPSISMEIENIEAELENLQAEATEASGRSPRKKISPNKLNKARRRYLTILEEDVNNRLQTSIHNARFIDIGSEESLDSTHLPWLYQGDGVSKVFNRFEEAFEQFKRRVLLLGAPGSGKTTTLLDVAQLLIRQAQDDPDAPIPLLFNLSKFRGKDNPSTSRTFFPWRSQRQTQTEEQPGEEAIADWLVQMMREYPGVSRKVATLWLAEEKVALLLDGLDEVDDRQLVRLVGYLNAYLREYPDLTVVVCSRIVEYQPLKDNKETRLQLERAVTLQPLNQQQIDSYLEKAEAIALRDALSEDRGLAELAQSPLTLSMMTLAYGGAAPKDIPANLSLVNRRRHLFDTYIDRMMQRKARRDRGIPFDLNPDNDVPEREYPYTREQVNRYLGWLAVRLSERMQTVLPLDRLYSFVAQEPENKENQKFWTEVKFTNAVFIVLSIIALTILLMPKTLDGIKQAALILSFLLPSSLFLGFVTNRTFSDNFPANELIEYSMKTLTIISIALLIGGAFGGLVNLLAVALPFAVSPLTLGAIVAVAITAILYIISNFNKSLIIYLLVTGGSIILPLIPVLLGQAIASLDIGIAASMVTAQWIFFAVKLYREDEGIFSALLSSSEVVVIVALVGWLGIINISTPDWYEMIILLGLFLGIFWETVEKNLRSVLAVIVLAALIGGWVANAVGSLVVVLSIIGLTFLYDYDNEVGEQLIRTIESSNLTDKFLYNPILKFVLTIHRSIPANCNRLLNYGISALLLKKVGTEYEFVHRLLRDHFAIRELVPTLGDNAELEQRLQSIKQLSFQGESAFDTLAALAQDENPRIREAAIQGLVRVTIPEVVPLLQTALEDSSIQVRKTVIDSLGKLPEEDSKKLLSKALQNSVLSVQLLAVSISKMRHDESEMGKQALAQIIAKMRHDESEMGKQALAQIIATTPLAQIIEALQERDKRVRQIAAEALGEAGNNEAVPSLVKALRDRDYSFRHNVKEALRKIGTPEALNALKQNADQETPDDQQPD